MTPKSYRALQLRARVPRSSVPCPLNPAGWGLPQGCAASRALAVASVLRAEGNRFEARLWIDECRRRRAAGRVKVVP